MKTQTSIAASRLKALTRSPLRALGAPPVCTLTGLSVSGDGVNRGHMIGFLIGPANTTSLFGSTLFVSFRSTYRQGGQNIDFGDWIQSPALQSYETNISSLRSPPAVLFPHGKWKVELFFTSIYDLPGSVKVYLFRGEKNDTGEWTKSTELQLLEVVSSDGQLVSQVVPPNLNNLPTTEFALNSDGYFQFIMPEEIRFCQPMFQAWCFYSFPSDPFFLHFPFPNEDRIVIRGDYEGGINNHNGWVLFRLNIRMTRIPNLHALFIYGFPDSETGRVVNFSDRTIADDGLSNPTAWAWDFGDGSTSTLRNPSHEFADIGEYVVRLTVLNSSGESSTFSQRVIIPFYLQVIRIEPSSGRPSTIFEFKTITSAVPDSVLWDFGDGSTSTLLSPTHQYAGPGIYNVNWSGLRNGIPPYLGDNASFSKQVNVTELVAAFSLVQTPNTRQVSFTDLSGPPGAIMSWRWTHSEGFGTETTFSTEQNPVYTFPSNIGFVTRITLRIFDVNGLAVSTFRNIVFQV